MCVQTAGMPSNNSATNITITFERLRLIIFLVDFINIFNSNQQMEMDFGNGNGKTAGLVYSFLSN
jgi:hypothetical protein